MSCRFTILACIAVLLATGCAKKTENIAATPISDEKASKLAQMNCKQIMQAKAYTQDKLSREGAVQNNKASDDKLMVAGGVALFLPLLFFTDGNSGAPNIAELKGVVEALEGQAASRGCKPAGGNIL